MSAQEIATPAARPAVFSIPIGVWIGMALGAVGAAASGQIVAFLGLRYLTDTMAVSAGLAGLIFFIIRVYDAIVDPLIGLASDKTRSPLGRRLPFLLAGSVLVPLTTLWVFNAPQLASGAATTVMLIVILAAYGTAQSVWAVPYYAMAVELSSDYHGRSSIMAARVAGGSVGQIIGSSVPTWLLVYWGHSHAAYGKMSVVVSIMAFVVLLAGTFMLRRAKRTSYVAGDHHVLTQLKTAWGNKPFRTLALTHVVFLLGVATVTASNAYFSRDIFQRTDLWLGAFYLVLIAGNVIAMPIWMRISRKFDKRLSYQSALAGYGLLHLTWLLANPSETVTMSLVRVFFIGLFMGGVVLMSYSALSDAIRYDFVRSGLRREGTFSGAMSFIDKVSAALGIAAMGFILSATGYVSSTNGGGGLKSHSVLMGLYLNFSIIPAATALISILLLAGYNLKQSDLATDSD